MSPIKHNKNSSNSQNFNFQNLQPINYLKTFNKMLQHISKPSTQSLDSSKQLKTVRLSKFPLHTYYQQMQGIFQGGGKKLNQAEKASKKDVQLEKLQQKFLKRHYTFVKGALQKIIQDNQSQQNLLLKSKNFYQTNQLQRTGPEYEAQIVKMVKLRSQPKLRSIKTTIDSARKTLQENTSRVSNYNSVHTLNNKSLVKRNHTKHDSEKSMESNRKPHRKTNSNQQGTKDMKTQYSSLTKDETRKNKHSVTQHQQINNEQEHNPIFKKLKQPQKIQRFRKRNNNEVDFILSARKTLIEPKQKNSIETVYPMTDRTHHNQKNSNMDKSSQAKDSLKRIQTNQPKNPKLKFKESLREKIFEADENQQDKSCNSEELNSFKKEINLKNHKKRKSDSLEKDSLKDECQDEDSKFFKEVEFLQRQQTKRQQQYASLVEDKVKQVKEKLNEKIKEVKKFDYLAPKQSPKNTKNKKETN